MSVSSQNDMAAVRWQVREGDGKQPLLLPDQVATAHPHQVVGVALRQLEFTRVGKLDGDQRHSQAIAKDSDN